METRKLYYEDSHLKKFEAKVISCTPQGPSWEVTLDATAFYPEGGGQAGDTGYIGDVRVFDTHEKGGIVSHYTESAIAVGTKVSCKIDWLRRFKFMQIHVNTDETIAKLIDEVAAQRRLTEIALKQNSDLIAILAKDSN